MIEMAIFITVFIVGLFLGALSYSWFYKPETHQHLQDELEKCRLDHLQKQEELQDYFSQSYTQLRCFNEQLSVLNRSWNAASQRFLEDSEPTRLDYPESLASSSMKTSTQDLMELADEPAIDLLNESDSEPSLKPFTSPSCSKASQESSS